MTATRLRGEGRAYDNLLHHGRRARLTHRAGERVEVIVARPTVNEILVDVDHVPAAWRRETIRVQHTQVVCVGLRGSRELTHHNRGIVIDVRQRGCGRVGTRRTGALTHGDHGVDATRERGRTASATPPTSLNSMTSRDRHGRGLRRPLHPLGSPGALSRSEVFDDLVLDAAERLEARWGRAWGRLEFGTEDVPPSDPSPWERGVPLGRLFPADLGQAGRIVLYRRPMEQRSEPHELPGLVRDVLAEHVGFVLDKSPDEVDPDYGMGT